MKKSYFLLLIIMAVLGLRPVCAQSTVYTQLDNQMTAIEDAGTTVNESKPNGPNQFTKFISEAIMAASYGLITDAEYQAIHQRILDQLRRKNGGNYIYGNTFTITEVGNNGTIGANTIGWNGSANNANKIYMLNGNATITDLQTINLRGDGTPGIMIFIPVNDNVTPKVTLGFNPNTDQPMFTVNGGNLILLGNRGSEKRLAFDGGATYSNNNPANGSEAALRTVTGACRKQAAVFYGVKEQTLNGHTYSELGGAYVANSEFRNFYFQKNGVFTVYSSNTSTSIAKAKSMGIYNTYFHDNLIGSNTVGVAVQLNASLSSGEPEQEVFSEFTPTYFTWPAGETKISGLCIGRSSFERNVAKRGSDTNAEALSQQYVRGGVGGADIGGRHGIIQVRVSNTTFSKSFARWYGGSIFWNRGEDGCLLTLDNCTFEYCHGHLGGAVYNEGNISIKGCTFNNNKAICNGSEGDGGAYLAGNNGYEGCGGAIFSRPSNATGEFTVPRGALVLDGCTFSGNHADTDGGAVCAYVDKNSQASADNRDIYFDLTVNSDTKLYNNTADRCGGAVALTIDPRVVNSTDGYQYVLHTTASLNYGEASGNVANGTNKLSNKYKTGTKDTDPVYELAPWFDEPGDGGGFYIEKTPTTIGTSTTGFTLDGNKSIKNGGGIFVKDATVTFNDGSVVANESTQNGGAVYVDGGNFTMHDGTLGTSAKPNKTGSSYNGGGVYVKGGNFTAEGGSINYNQAKDGGGVYCQGGSVTVSNGTVVDHNKATNLGGGFYSASGVTVDASTVSKNSSVLGGGFYCASGTTVVRNNSVVTGNTASDHGAGFYVGGGTATITGSEVSENVAEDNGGGVYSNGGAITIIDAKIESNEAVNGGGVYSNGGTINISYTSDENGGLLSNKAVNGGGCYMSKGTGAGGTLTINGGNIDGNSASGNGGGFYVDGGTLNLYGGIIGKTNGNHAVGNGGGFYLSGGVANIKKAAGSSTSATVQYNTAANGAGIYMKGTNSSSKAVANFEDGTIQNNVASANGGGIYLANHSELKMSGASTITGNHVPATGRGGGVYKQGRDKSLLWVSGTQLKITGNYLGDTYSSATRNNAFLYDYDDFITVDPEHSISSGVKVGVSVNVDDVYEDLPTPVIYCEDGDKVNAIFYMLKEATGDNGIFDDAKKYTAVYTSSPDPFNTNQIFFVSTWASFNEQPEGFSYDNIDSPEDLAYFMTLVNGTNAGSEGPQSNLNGTVTADIDMSGDNWVPIGEYDHNDTDISQELAAKYFYSGTFEGNGHTISGLKTMGLIGYYNYGMFGMTHGATIRNVVLADCEFVSGECARMANLIGEMSGGVAENCIVSGTLTPAGSETQQGEGPHKVVVGGLVGEAKDLETVSPVIRNCIATAQIDATTKDDGGIYPNQQAYTVGGLVGLTTANTIIENCFSNPEIKHAGSQGEDQTVPENANRYVGGLVGENYGSVKNCYVRLERNNELTATISMFGMFAGYNDGTIDYCYYPELSLRNIKVGSSSTPNQPLILAGSQTTPAHYGQYNAVILPYTYTSYLKDNQVMMDNESAYGTEEATTLLSRLNDWVDAQTTSENYSQWMRTKASDVNADYPVLSYDNIISTLNYTTVGSKDGIRLEYDNSFNDIYDRFAAETEKEGCLFVYRTPWSGTISSPVSEFITADNSDNDIKVYVEDGVALLQNADSKLVNTYTCQEFDDASRSWHLISSSLNGNSPIGFSYANYSEYNENPNPCGASIATGSYKSFFPQGIPMADLDLYCFYETEYHWINFKRRTDSHWHMNDQHQNIVYTNENSLVPGKGYLASFAGRTLLQAGGELTSGDVYLPVTIDAGSLNASASPTAIPANEGTELKGYNLLANPYQSYLDLGEFLTVNSGLFSGSSKSGALIPTYAVYDPEKGAYVQGMASTPSRGSYAPTGTLGMHEGFFIVAANSGKDAKFTNAMRLDKATSSAKRAEQPAYPLVNLMVADASGDSDIAVVEFGRPQVEGAAKMMNIGANGKVYFHYNGDDCALLYLDDATDHLPVHFDALEDGTYTMTWSTANATFSYLHLIDNMTGMDIDMLTSDGYTFTSNSSDYKSRFKMMFAYTGVEENGAAETETFAFMHDGNLVVNGEGWLEVIDLCGRTIASTKLTNAQNTMSLPQAAQGVYVLKLTSNNMTKVQKIVVE